MTAVKEGGYIYIYYYMPMMTSDYERYSSNFYLRSYEIKSYFDPNFWDVEFCKENNIRQHKGHPYNIKDHSHNVGVLLARKINGRRKYVYNYVYTINREK